jgi:hypothetical protein
MLGPPPGRGGDHEDLAEEVSTIDRIERLISIGPSRFGDATRSARRRQEEENA